MIKLLDILENKILVPRRSPEERSKNHNIALQKQIQQYIKNRRKGNLNLKDTPITSLPQGLKVGGYLDLEFTPITSLPNGLKVGEYLYLKNTPLSKKYSEDEIRQMIEDGGGYVGGDIYT